jgi:hypothetical protein
MEHIKTAKGIKLCYKLNTQKIQKIFDFSYLKQKTVCVYTYLLSKLDSAIYNVTDGVTEKSCEEVAVSMFVLSAVECRE